MKFCSKTLTPPGPGMKKTFLTFWVTLGPYRWIYIDKYDPFRCFYKNFRPRPFLSIFRVPDPGGYRGCLRGVQNRSSEVKNHDFDLKIDVRPPKYII